MDTSVLTSTKCYTFMFLLYLFHIDLTLTTGSKKKGVCVGHHDFLCGDLKTLNQVAWWYDWALDLSFYHNHTNCTYIDRNASNHVPMIWGRGSISNKTISIPHNAYAVLGFNEPNHRDQSNLTAAEAASYWPEVEKLALRIPLVSPAAAPCSGSKCISDTTAWFDEFFKLCLNCRVDYLATHIYDCDADKTMQILEQLYERYGKKIWLTEFACPYTVDSEKELQYMKQILPLLEEADFVHRYSWFISRTGNTEKFITPVANLLETNSSTLTPLGRFYNNFEGINVEKGVFDKQEVKDHYVGKWNNNTINGIDNIVNKGPLNLLKRFTSWLVALFQNWHTRWQ